MRNAMESPVPRAMAMSRAVGLRGGSGSLAGPRPGELVSEEFMRNRDGEMEGMRYIYSLPGGLELQVERFVAGGQLRGLRVRGSMDEDPVLWAAAGPQCQVQAARVLRYGARGMATELLHLGEDLTRVTAREPLNPAVPTGTDPGGVRVALVDSGVNYQLTGIASRLRKGRKRYRELGYTAYTCLCRGAGDLEAFKDRPAAEHPDGHSGIDTTII